MEEKKHNGKAITSMVLGIVGLGAWIIPFFGAPITIVGLVLGSFGLKSSYRGMAIAGVVTSIVGLVLTVTNAILGVLFFTSLFI